MAVRQDPADPTVSRSTTPVPARPPAMPRSSGGSGREAQRRRTRRAIVEATQRLLAGGDPAPSIDEIAASADVSRRTIYMHFSTLDQLLLDAALGALSGAYVDTALESAASAATHVAAHGDDVQARVAALVDALLDIGDTTLPLGRQIMRLTIDRAPSGEATDDTGRHAASVPQIRRGGRRTDWIEAAISPLVGVLSTDQHERLVSGLSLVLGFEAMIVLRDVRGLDRATEREVSLWAARALVSATLSELGDADAGSSSA